MASINRKHRGSFLRVVPSGFMDLHPHYTRGQGMAALATLQPLGSTSAPRIGAMNERYGTTFDRVGKLKSYYGQQPMMIGETDRVGDVYHRGMMQNMSTMKGQGPYGVNATLASNAPTVERRDGLMQ